MRKAVRDVRQGDRVVSIGGNVVPVGPLEVHKVVDVVSDGVVTARRLYVSGPEHKRLAPRQLGPGVVVEVLT